MHCGRCAAEQDRVCTAASSLQASLMHTSATWPPASSQFCSWAAAAPSGSVFSTSCLVKTPSGKGEQQHCCSPLGSRLEAAGCWLFEEVWSSAAHTDIAAH